MKQKDIYDDFKLKKPFGLHVLYKKMSALSGLVTCDVLVTFDTS